MRVEEAQQAIGQMVSGSSVDAKLRSGFAAFRARYYPVPLSPVEEQRLFNAYAAGYMNAYEESTEQFKAVQRLKREVQR